MLIYLNFFLSCFLISTFCYAQDKIIHKEKFNLYPKAENSIGYTQAVKVGNLLYLSGTVGEGDSMRMQLISAYDDIRKTLSNYGATFSNVVKETIYTTDIEALKRNQEVRKAYYKEDWPASTWIEIKRLYLPEFMVEIEVVAVLTE